MGKERLEIPLSDRYRRAIQSRNLPPGLFNVQAFAEGFQLKTEQVRIGEGERTILKIFLEREGR
ncbi:MAG: hypothetical protein N2234_03890 [Planctomycetota bacterium]|nr:hypothetical protein [Planctomycetota bacterium]